MKKSLLITGGGGYIAQALSCRLKAHDVTTIKRGDFDLTDQGATAAWFKDKYFDVVIHTAIKGGRRLEEDAMDVFEDNLQMFLNLFKNKRNFGRFLNLGSGAEVGEPEDPYGFSKNVISKTILLQPNFHNIRIFGIFDAHELPNRFIKANIQRYIDKKPMEVFENKKMDFFYMEDLWRLINYFINVEKPLKVVECCYNQTYSLSEIVELINMLDSYRVEIKQENWGASTDYTGTTSAENLPIKFKGLKAGIRQTFNIIKTK